MLNVITVLLSSAGWDKVDGTSRKQYSLKVKSIDFKIRPILYH